MSRTLTPFPFDCPTHFLFVTSINITQTSLYISITTYICSVLHNDVEERMPVA